MIPFLVVAQLGAAAGSTSARTARLEAMAALDGAVHYFHPVVASRSTSWDSSVAASVVRIADAPTPAALRAELTGLLSALGDPLTRVVPPSLPGQWTVTTSGSTATVVWSPDMAAPKSLAPTMSGATHIVVDLRGGDPQRLDAALAPVLVRDSETAPPQRSLSYDGFPPSTALPSGYSAYEHPVPGEQLRGQSPVSRSVTFIADGQTILSPLALALRQSGRAAILAVGDSTVPMDAATFRIAMGDGVLVDVRIADRITARGVGRFRADTVVAASTPIAAVRRAAAAFATALPPLAVPTVGTDSLPTFAIPSTGLEAQAFPSTGFRLLGAFRVWSTIHHFYPYKSLMQDDWELALRTAIPAVETAKNATDYVKAIARMATHVHDSHVSIGSSALFSAVWGGSLPPVEVRFVEGHVVVTRLLNDPNARRSIHPGDVVVAIDGTPVADREAAMEPYIPASTPQALQSAVAQWLLGGPDGSVARLTLQDSTGAERVTGVTRAAQWIVPLAHPRDGQIFRQLSPDIGYADLDRLPLTMVDSMFATFKGTRAIIFDMRGYPNGTAWVIAPWLNTHPDPTPAAQFSPLFITSPDTSTTVRRPLTQTIPAQTDPSHKYTGRTFMLYDERAISQAEQTGLFFESANHTTFVGTPSRGANGDITNVRVPGGITMSFTGDAVQHADGRQLQRVGILPDIPAAPTIAGIRAGRDEVLEAAFHAAGGVGPVFFDTTHAAPLRVVGQTLPAEPAIPGWSPGSPDAYRVGLDTTTAHGGRSSGHMTARGVPGQVGVMAQSIRADQYRGRRVRYSAYIRTNGLQLFGGARLWMRVDGRGGTLAYDNMEAHPVTGTRDWARYQIVLDVPDDADGLSFGMTLDNVSGEAWIDDATIDVVDSTVAVTSSMPSAPNAPTSAAAVAMTRRYANTPIAPSNLGFERIP